MRCSYQIGESKGVLNPEHPDGKRWELKDETLAKNCKNCSCKNCKKTKYTCGQCQCSVVKLKCIDLCFCARCENMDGDHDNDEEIGEQGASDDDYDIGTDGSEHLSR